MKLKYIDSVHSLHVRDNSFASFILLSHIWYSLNLYQQIHLFAVYVQLTFKVVV